MKYFVSYNLCIIPSNVKSSGSSIVEYNGGFQDDMKLLEFQHAVEDHVVKQWAIEGAMCHILFFKEVE